MGEMTRKGRGGRRKDERDGKEKRRNGEGRGVQEEKRRGKVRKKIIWRGRERGEERWERREGAR